MANWQDLLPGVDGSKLGEEVMIEQEAVRRILVKTELSGSVKCDTFDELMTQTGFPLKLVVHKFRPRELDNLDTGMRRHPTKTPLIMAVDEIVERCPGIPPYDIGMVFPWRGFGGIHVLTCDTGLPQRPGTHGRYWALGGMYYLLAHIDSFIIRLGPAEEW